MPPPANSPVRDPSRLDPAQPSRASSRTPSPSTFLPVLRELGSPVPDLASTLTIQAENDVDAENVSFLRSPSVGADDASVGQNMSRLTGQESTTRRQREAMLRNRHSEEHREQRRLRDVHLRQRYNSHDSWVESMRQTASRSPYGDRTPNQQSLYDWAPATEEGDEAELEEILADLRAQQPQTHPDILHVLGRAQLDAQNEQRRLALARTPANTQPAPHEHSLRSAAILRSVRANRQLSARSRDLMQRYVMDRERAGLDPEARDRSNSSLWFRVAAEPNVEPSSNAPEPERSNRDREREERRRAHRALQQERDDASAHAASLTANLAASAAGRRSGETMDSLRRRYLEDPGGAPHKFENTIKLLDWLRHPDCDINELLKSLTKEINDAGVSLAIPDLAQLSTGFPPPQTSWLAPGMVFSGFQHAAPANASSTTLYRLANNQTISSTTLGPTPHSAINPLPPRAPGSSMTSASGTAAAAQRDRWAVRVSIHSVDYESMTLQGTMEAFDVPSIPSGAASVPYRSSTSALRSTIATAAELANGSPPSDPAAAAAASARPPSTFSTYLEGELLDLHTHTLATHSFPAATSDDAKYWRRLAPFARMPDHAMARAAIDPAWLAAELRDKYVLMRWKERCFVRECMLGREAGSPGSQGGSGGGGGGENTNGGGFGVLSISGFYYVSMRRDDGRIEGLYFDPASSPYQHLELEPEGARGSGAWEFA